jgi:predicted YcjX-like family ATPase
MFDDVKYLEKILELVKERKICLSSMSYDEDLGLNYVKDKGGNYISTKGVSDISLNLEFTGHSDSVMKVLSSLSGQSE